MKFFTMKQQNPLNPLRSFNFRNPCRLAMPELDNDGFLDCLKQLLKMDESWIPQEEGYSLYIRPTAIGNSPFLGTNLTDLLYYSCLSFSPFMAFSQFANVLHLSIASELLLLEIFSLKFMKHCFDLFLC